MLLDRRLTITVLALLVAALAATPSVAHDDRGDTSEASAFRELLAQRQGLAFDGVAEPAAPQSNAPTGFAPCVRGMAADTWACDGVDLWGHVPLDGLGLSFVNDMWGWTDPATGRDYALVGGIEGTTFVDVSDRKRPVVVGMLPAHTLDPAFPFWRDLKVHADHVYVVSEAEDHGMQVFDLTRLRDATGEGPTTFDEDGHLAWEGGWAHNVGINEDTGFAYVVGSPVCEGGLFMVDLASPSDPVPAGCFAEHGYIHDVQCVVYEGPDTEHHGHEICFGANAHFPPDAESILDLENRLSIVDVTDKSAPVGLARVDYPEAGYSHQGWLTEDQAYFLHGDELDELLWGVSTRTRVWDVRDLDAPTLHHVFDNSTPAIDHNVYTDGGRAYASNYTSGLRVYDVTGIGDGAMREVGYFDVYPANDDASFEGGTWSNFPWFRRDLVAVSSIDQGLFVLRPRGDN